MANPHAAFNSLSMKQKIAVRKKTNAVLDMFSLFLDEDFDMDELDEKTTERVLKPGECLY